MTLFGIFLPPVFHLVLENSVAESPPKDNNLRRRTQLKGLSISPTFAILESGDSSHQSFL